MNCRKRILTISSVLVVTGMACGLTATPTVIPKNRENQVITATHAAQQQVDEDRQGETEQSFTLQEIHTAKVLVASLNIRRGAGSNFPIDGYVSQDEILQVFAKSSDGYWILIDPEKSGWISSSYVELDTDLDDIPVYTTEMQFEAIASFSATPTSVKPEPGEESHLTATPQSSMPPISIDRNFEIVSLSIYSQDAETIMVFGELVNKSKLPMKNIRINNYLIDDKGIITAFDTGNVLVPWWYSLSHTGLLFPGEKAPFSAYFQIQSEWKEIDHDVFYELVEHDELELSNYYRDISLQNDSIVSLDNELKNFVISGEFLNTGMSSCSTIWIIATIYDKRGEIIGMDEMVTDTEIVQPGELKAFKFPVFARGDAEDYHLLFYAFKN